MQLLRQPHSFAGGWVSGQLAVYAAARTLGLSNTYSTQHLQAECSALEGKKILCGHSAPFPRAPSLFSPPQPLSTSDWTSQGVEGQGRTLND